MKNFNSRHAVQGKRGLILREDIVSPKANFLLLPIPFFVQIIISDLDMQP